MPVWAAAYLAVYTAFSLWSFSDDVVQRGFGPWAAVELVGVTCLLTAGLAFWIPAMRAALGGVAAWIFLAGLSALIAFSLHQVRRTLAEARRPWRQRVELAASGFALLAVLHAPLLWSGSQLLR